jgi:hypothetical protein
VGAHSVTWYQGICHELSKERASGLSCRHLVVLLRANTISRYLSVASLAQTKWVAKTVHETSSKFVSPKLTLDTNNLVQRLDIIAKENQWLREAASSHRGPVMMLLYEEFFAGTTARRETTTLTLQEFLHVEPLPLTLEHIKMRRGTLADSITNFDAVRSALEGTDHARWLDQA